MDKDKLNKKLAEWRGLTPLPTGDGSLVFYDIEKNCSIHFPDSLDACFKWLVPEALRRIASIHNTRIQKAFEILLRFWSDERAKIDEPDVDALSLCLTIEKLIDLEKAKKPYQDR